MTVLVLSDERDPTVDAVVALLTRAGAPVFRCDTAWFPTRLTLAAVINGSRWTGELRGRHRVLQLDDVRSVWYRKPTAFVLPAGFSDAERQHAMWEAKLGVGGVLADLYARWVNHPHCEADLAYKPRQLTRAAACGLAVPPTLVTNDPGSVRDFADTYSEVIIKPLAGSSIREHGVTHALYTSAVDPTDLTDMGGIETTAHLFQARIKKAFEVRLTMVGAEPFAAAIYADSDEAALDWRTDLNHVRIEPMSLPGAVLAAVLRFMRSYPINFGAFDFAVTPDGEWVFFECNGAGQFGFIECATGMPINAALAALLSERDAYHDY